MELLHNLVNILKISDIFFKKSGIIHNLNYKLSKKSNFKLNIIIFCNN